MRRPARGEDPVSSSAPSSSGPSSPSPAHPAARSAFRGDVQGLRAIAVLTVIASHYGLSFLSGGYVGVDVFFVISGFLISQLLFREVERSGRLSIADFYARRARRILPAATLVTLVTVVLSLLLISVVDALDLVTDAVWATFFAANIRFSAVGTDYFAQDQAPSPLQHYWSLSVEEQFYLVWPLLLLAVVAAVVALRRRRGASAGGRVASRSRLPRLALFWVLLVGGAASFVHGVLLTHASPTAAYFSTPARAWELAVGALTALVARSVAARLPSAARGAIAVGGLVAIAVACALYTDATPFPGTAAALPVLGSAAVLLAGAGGHAREPLPIRALGVRPMRVVGDWSYSLYLWHWSLLIIARGHEGELGLIDKLGLVALTFVLAALTYRWVETPFRSPMRLPRVRALSLYPASVVLVCLTGLVGSLYGHYKSGEFGHNPGITVANSGILKTDDSLSQDPVVALVQASVTAALDDRPIPSHLDPTLISLREDKADVGGCDYSITGLRTLCPRGDTGADRSIVVIGNSHGRMWIPPLEKIADAEHYKTYYFVKPNCTAADLVTSDVDTATPLAPWEDCTSFRAWALEQIATIHPVLSIVATSGPNPVIFTADGEKVTQDSPDRQPVTQAGFEKILTELGEVSDRVVLLRDVPKSVQDPGTCLSGSGGSLKTCLFKPFQPQEDDSDSSMRAAEQVGVQHIDPTKWLCWKNRCPVVIGTMLPYRDRGHLTTVYAEYLAPELARKMHLAAD